MWRSLVAALLVALLFSACGQATPAPRATHHPAGNRSPTTSTAASIPVRRHRKVGHRPDPGRLPQTSQKPSAATRQFRAEMAALWRGITSGRTAPALSAFFPEAAYVQVKAIGDPQADWHTRLVGGFSADIAAAHALLGRGADRARLIGVRVPAGYAHWVPPDTCYNRVGYWETPNSRLVYLEGGQVRSFGIASLISWRGVWYVVHLGAVLRTGTGGVVDDPSAGAGYPAPSSTC
jgi:hypothetical protein